MSLADATSGTPPASDFIRLLEADDPQIKSLKLQLSFTNGSVQVVLIGNRRDKLPRVVVLSSDPDQWEQIGLGIGRCTKLRELRLIPPVDVDNLPAKSMQCLEALYEGLKHNTSVQYLSVFFQGGNDFSIFDWEYFMRNNTQIKYLIISSRRQLQSDQGMTIELLLHSSLSLETLRMQRCEFLDNGVLEQILSACSGIRILSLECDEIYKCTAVADFLRNRATEIRDLCITRVVQGGLPIIVESLANNTTLKTLEIW
eukprot:scaffold2448_cov24-Cyclotella_meneghiniana.AAC.1